MKLLLYGVISRGYIANDLDVIWDSLYAVLAMSQSPAYLGEKTSFTVNVTYRYDGTKPSLVSYNVYIDEKLATMVADAAFELVFDATGAYKITIGELTDEIYLVDYSSGFKSLNVEVKIRAEAGASDGEDLGRMASQWIIILAIASSFVVAYYKVIKPGWDNFKRNSENKAVMRQNSRLTTGKNSIQTNMNKGAKGPSGAKRRPRKRGG